MKPLQALFLLALPVAEFTAEGQQMAVSPPKEDSRTVRIDTPGLEIEAVLGLGRRRDSQLPTPIVITAENRTGQAISGVWEVEESPDGMKHRVSRLVTMEATVPASTAVRTRFCLSLKESLLTVRLRRGRQVLWQRTCQRGEEWGMWASEIDRSALNFLAVHGRPQEVEFARSPGPERQNQNFPALPQLGTRRAFFRSVSGWELPNDAAPLFAFRALIFSQEADIQSLGPGQLKALANYLLWGGMVVIPKKRADILESLRLRLPSEPVALEGDFQGVGGRDEPSLAAYAVGAGRLVVIAAEPFFGDLETANLRERIVAYSETEPEPAFPRYLAPARDMRRGLSANAMTTLSLVGVVFLFYALLTGPAVWVLFRKASRKALALYVVGTVGTFCVLALFIGPFLGLYRGDAEWLTVTELTPTGGIQWGLLTLTSAGARKHHVQLEGERVESYLLPTETLSDWRFRYRFGWNPQQSPLGDARNLAFDILGEPDAPAGKEVPIPPWGSRLLLANAYWPEGRPVGVRVWLKDKKFVVEVQNSLPWALQQASVSLGAWTTGNSPWGGQNQESDFYQVFSFGTIGAGKGNARLEGADLSQKDRSGDIRRAGNAQLEAAVGLTYNFWNWITTATQAASSYSPKASPGFAQIYLPRVNAQRRLFGYLVARIDQSPELAVKGPSFLPNDGVHLIVQRIPASDLPDPEEVFRVLAEGAKEQAGKGRGRSEK